MLSVPRFLLLFLVAVAVVAPNLNADVLLLKDFYGTASFTIPAYYVAFCSGNNCNGTEGYPLTVAGNTIPGTVYIGDPGGYVSDMIVTSFPLGGGCTVGGVHYTPTQCTAYFSNLHFDITSGLDLTGTPMTCGSVGGCQYTYDGSVQTLGEITWGPGLLTPVPGTVTTLQFQGLTGTVHTTTLTDFSGGSSLDPVLLPQGDPVGSISGQIGGQGTSDYYMFQWNGGFFSATASITGPPDNSASYLFAAGLSGSCNSVGSAMLDSSDNFSGTIAINNLAAGRYCIGIEANNPNDPPFSLTFNSPVEGIPEPSTFLLLAGAGIAGALRKISGRHRA